jgi:anti-sigma B factor antagonist
MELSINHYENASVISINGEIDSVTGPELNRYFQKQLLEQKNLIADLSNVDYMSSAGLRVLLLTLKASRKIGGDLRLVNVQENVFTVLDIAGFTKIIRVFGTIDEAKVGL